jgi:hypothetical protein
MLRFGFEFKKWNEEKKIDRKEFFRDKMQQDKSKNFVTKRNWNILISQTFKQAEQMIETLREENSCDHHKYKQFIFFGVLTHKKWSSRHVFFPMDITFYWHSYLLLNFLLLTLTSFILFSHCYAPRLPTYLPKIKFLCGSSLFLASGLTNAYVCMNKMNYIFRYLSLLLLNFY